MNSLARAFDSDLLPDLLPGLLPGFLLSFLLAALVACGPQVPELLDVPSTETTAFETGVQKQLAEAYATVAQLTPKSSAAEQARAFGELGRTLHAYELRDAAELAYRNAKRLVPEEADWVYLLGVVLQERGEIEGAVEAFERTLELLPEDLPARLRLGQTLFDGNRLEEARVHLERALELDADCALASFFLAQVALAEQDFAAAAAYLEHTLKLQNDADRAYHALARAYRGLDDLDKAGRALALAGDREVRLEDPRFQAMKEYEVSAAGYVRRAARAQVAGALDAALREYRRAIETAPENAEAHAGLGATLAELGQVEEAKEQLREAIRLGADSAWLRYNLAGAHRLADQPELAMTEYRKGLEHDPRHVESMLGLADILASSDRSAEAIKVLEEALAIGEKKASVHLRLAAIHSQAGRTEAAEKARQAVLDSDPTPAERAGVYQQIADQARSRGDAAGAIAALTSAFEAAPKDLSILFSLANLLGATGQFEAAAAAYSRVSEGSPKRPEVWLGLATALALAGRPDDAIARLAEARDHLPDHPDLQLALARLLIVHPQPEQRDHSQALTLIDSAARAGVTLQHVELKALALAELGRFDDAIYFQERLINDLRQVQPELASAAEARLEDFRRRAKESAS